LFISFDKYIIDLNNSSPKEILEDFVSLFYPHYCRGCENALVKGESLICSKCLLELSRTNDHYDSENPFFKKFKGRLPLSYAMAFFKFVKSSRIQHLLHALKYKNQPEIGRMFGTMYGDELLKTHAEKFDVILSIPLHGSKQRKRGYNQSDEFGKGLSEVLSVPCSDTVLKRVVATETQTRKSKLNRWENVGDVFKVVDSAVITGKRILLVDDVVTTGATLEACGQSIIKAQCESLSIACIASTQ
jgi:ComF family protein